MIMNYEFIKVLKMFPVLYWDVVQITRKGNIFLTFVGNFKIHDTIIQFCFFFYNIKEYKIQKCPNVFLQDERNSFTSIKIFIISNIIR